MNYSGSSSAISRHAVDNLVDLSGETEVPKYMRFFVLHQLSDDSAFHKIIRDRAETSRARIDHLHIMICGMFDALSDLIAQDKETIRMKEVVLRCSGLDSVLDFESVKIKILTTCNQICDKGICKEKTWSIGEDYKLASVINRVSMEVQNVVITRDEFIEELDSLGVRLVPAILAELMKLIQRKDRETMAKLQILEKEMEFNASQK
nr:hypothetical protein [Tanacetum cinerariifolium]